MFPSTLAKCILMPFGDVNVFPDSPQSSANQARSISCYFPGADTHENNMRYSWAD